MRRATFAGLLLFACLLAAPAAAEPAAGKLQLYVMPDTQSWAWNQGGTTLETWRSVAKALCRQRERFAMVLHTGDLVDEHRLRPVEWSNALSVLEQLGACGLPLAIAFGNHDFDNYPNPPNVVLQGHRGWSEVVTKLAPRPIATGPSGRSALRPLGPGWFVVTGDFYVAKRDLDWLAAEIAARPGARFVFLQHQCVNTKGVAFDWCRAIFERHPEIRLAVSGHWLGPDRDEWKEVPRANGEPLVALYQNYQHVPALAAWGVVIELDPASGAACVWTEDLLSGETRRPAAASRELGEIGAGPERRCFGGSARSG